ncbi:hypothetical protein D9619_001715 [Psilocybe cf. subviscida]|uniref:PinX1-related protein 1 n=1 Tax=Psilocybe cf. subviscida TaxID=2480587 RepID=A0A8H5BFG2_9AGAR|nr:hypothetical protein D9619_001715 [Psilocybe cf. subviscida]
MGLSGRKVKQRIGADPRNLSWADDAARFGQNYLSKFGWDASKGLGAGGDGMKSHIKVSHKLDMLGIGAAQTKDPNGIAWKQNRDFESLLERLNKGLAEDAAASSAPDADGDNDKDADGETPKEGEDKKKKKRKHKETDESESDRKEKKSKKSKKAEKDEVDAEKTVSVVSESVQVEEVVEVRKTVVVPRHRAHRARAIAAKNISSKSAAHVSEILGIAPDSTPTPPVDSEPMTGKLTSVTETDALGMDKITTSTKSLADYFKEKLNARLGSGSGDSGSSTPSSSRLDEEEDRPRGGIGSSRMLLEIRTETKVEEETQRVGLSKFSSLMSSQFLAAASSMSSYVPVVEQDVKMQEPGSSARISEVESSGSSSEEEEVKPKEKRTKEKKEKKHEHKTLEVAREEEDVKLKKERKSKKDKKGKSKAKEEDEVEEQENAEVDEKTRRKLEKKAKKEKKAKLEAAAEEEEQDKAASEAEDKLSRKKDKRKHKSSKSSEPSAESEKSEPKKERRKSSSGDS